MNVSAEHSTSLWMSTEPLEQAQPLGADSEADVVIVGAGIAGLSAAYELALEGRSILVLDRGAIGGGMTARTTAHLTSEIDDYYSEYIKLRGEAEAAAYYRSQAAAIDRVEEIQAAEDIACDFARVDGFLFLGQGRDRSLLEREIEACHAIGFDSVMWAERAPVPGANTGHCLRFPRQGRFHPLRYISGLSRAVRRYGGHIHGNSPVVSIEESGGLCQLRTEDGRIVRAGHCIVATNSPINDLVTIHTKQAPYRTYVIALEVARGAVADALLWDTLEPYHYVRLQPQADGPHDWLIVGGEDHKTGHSDEHEEPFQRLEAWTRDLFPDAGAVTHRWSGQVMEPVDYAPYIGVNPGSEKTYIVTGDSGEGITSGVVAGMLLRELVLGRETAWEKAYDPGRISLGASVEYVRENAIMARNLAEHLTGGEVSSPESLRPGEAALVRRGAKKLAAFRDELGELHLMSAACTHAGCIVHWNAFERCWDCPCHGSQFAGNGEPLNGPAVHPLAKAAQE